MLADIIATIGVDLGKNTFHICAMNDRGTIVLRENRSATMAFFEDFEEVMPGGGIKRFQTPLSALVASPMQVARPILAC